MLLDFGKLFNLSVLSFLICKMRRVAIIHYRVIESIRVHLKIADKVHRGEAIYIIVS